jgi:hypothetical protein
VLSADFSQKWQKLCYVYFTTNAKQQQKIIIAKRMRLISTLFLQERPKVKKYSVSSLLSQIWELSFQFTHDGFENRNTFREGVGEIPFHVYVV